MSHPDFHATTLKLINHDKVWFDKNFCINWLLFGVGFLSVFFKCSLKSTTPPSVLHLLAPNFCPMIMPCVQCNTVFSYKNNLAKQYFQKLVFQKPLNRGLHYKYLIWGMKIISKSIFETYQMQGSHKPQKYNFKGNFPILFKGFFFRPEMVFNRLKLF